MKYRVQTRTFEEVRQWLSPRCGRISKSHFSRWQTVSVHDTQAEAEAEFNRHTTGLKQARVVFGRKVLAELR